MELHEAPLPVWAVSGPLLHSKYFALTRMLRAPSLPSCLAPEGATGVCNRCTTDYLQHTFGHTSLPFCITCMQGIPAISIR